ncbi:hypothetical protein AAFF_G00396020 [Aldrovandia affinis]|uniref:Uncharacterized protein n=1 Tax=Aldrovandia affinis TaxID=143900 RepID=A0AAD7SDH6_9TELE|nr:hypothetical protein AAFF_G00396020 [Aldrovandia affinis]
MCQRALKGQRLTSEESSSVSPPFLGDRSRGSPRCRPRTHGEDAIENSATLTGSSAIPSLSPVKRDPRKPPQGS